MLLLALFVCFQKTGSACLVTEMSDLCCVHISTVIIASSTGLCLKINALPATLQLIVSSVAFWSSKFDSLTMTRHHSCECDQ